MADDKIYELVLGWRLTKGFDPEYWLEAAPKPGGHKRNQLVTVAAPEIARNTIIIAQSGSGKSFFLGRYLEEIALKTKSRILVLDPNSDFRKIKSPVSKELWQTAAYSPSRRGGFLPDEATLSKFARPWKRVKKAVYSFKESKRVAGSRIRIDWCDGSVDFVFTDIAAALRSEIRSCHEFLQQIFKLTKLMSPSKPLYETEFLTEVESILKEIIALDRAAERDATRFTRNGGLDAITPPEGKKGLHTTSAAADNTRPGGIVSSDTGAVLPESDNTIGYLRKTFAAPKAPKTAKAPETDGKFEVEYDSDTPWEVAIQRAAISRRFIFAESLRTYFSVAQRLAKTGILYLTAPDGKQESDDRIEVVDLPSIDDPDMRSMFVSHLLDQELKFARKRWETALAKDADLDERYPTFIVVDEAHNFVLADARTEIQRRLQEQFRTIAAEGRKFGLFLILVSQRPDKLDPWVLSEFENRAVMRIGSEVVLQKTVELLGLSSSASQMAEAALQFDKGRALLVGPWVGDTPTFLYGAARRTEDGGRNLREAYWAVPYRDLLRFPSVRYSHNRARPPQRKKTKKGRARP